MSGFNDFSTTPASNASIGAINFAEGQLPSTLNNSARQLMADLRYELGAISSVKTAGATTDLGATQEGVIELTGSATIGSFGTTGTAGLRKKVHVSSGTPTISCSTAGAIRGPTNAAIVCAQDDTFEVICEASDQWRIYSYQRADGSPLAAGTQVLSMSSKAINEAKGADIASAATTNIWATDGNTVHVTGTTTITSFGTAPQAGARRRVIFDGALTLTHAAATLVLPGAANITTAAGDIAEVIADTTTKHRVVFQKANGEAVVSSAIAQIVNTQTGTKATGTTVLPADNTIPQNTEGDQYMSLSITPTNSSSTLYIDVVCVLSTSAAAGSFLTAALFQDSTAGAIAGAVATPSVADAPMTITFRHKMTAGTTSATTFKVRAGYGNAGTTAFNGSGSTTLLGGAVASSITITEVLP